MQLEGYDVLPFSIINPPALYLTTAYYNRRSTPVIEDQHHGRVFLENKETGPSPKRKISSTEYNFRIIS